MCQVSMLRLLLQATLLLAGLGTALLVAAERTLALSALPNSPPDESSARILHEAYDRLGITLSIWVAPAERALVLANEGRSDGVVNRMPGIENEYPNLIMVPVPINQVEAAVFTRHHHFSVQGWESLRPYTIGIRRGIKFIERGTEQMEVYSTTTDEQLFQMLRQDRLDIVVLPRLVGMRTLTRLKIEGIEVLEEPITRIALYHYLHRRHANLLPAITATLQTMANEGRITAIQQAHLGLPSNQPLMEEKGSMP